MKIFKKYFDPLKRFPTGWYRILLSLWILITVSNSFFIIIVAFNYYLFAYDDFQVKVLMLFGFIGCFVGIPVILYLIIRFILWIYEGFKMDNKIN
jgi:hypothetical protein